MLLKKPLYLIPVDSKQELSDRITKFYEKGKINRIERYSDSISKKQNIRIKLRWNEKGLANISTPSGGLDLNNLGKRFMFHNIDENSEIGKSLINIANEYVNLLMED